MTETMQDSGVEWIGAIPKSWKVKIIKRNFDVKLGKMLQPLQKTELDTEELYLKTSNIYWDGVDINGINTMWFSPLDKANTELQLNDLLVCEGGDVGRSALWKEEITPCYIQNAINRVRPIHNCSTHYLFYWLFFLKHANYIDAMVSRITIAHLTAEKLERLIFLLPPIPEQQAIAQYLDERCGKLDSIIAIKKQQIQTLDALRQSIIYQAVTKGLDNSVKLVDSGVEWLGEIPKGWKVDKLKRISDIRYGLGQPPASKDDGLPMIRATDVYRGTIVGDKLLTIDPDTLPLGRNPYLKKDEIIVVRSGAYTGDSAIIPAQYAGAIAGYDMVVTVNRANPKFIAYCLLCDYVLERQLRLLMLRAAQPHLNSQELGGILLVLPKSNEDQQKIVDYLDDETQRLAQLKANLTQQIGVLLDYKKSLIYECVTGKKRVFKLVKNTKKGYSTL